MVKYFAVLLGCLLSTFALAQTDSSGYAIRIQIKGLRDSTCYLGYYFGAGQYVTQDTAKADTSGTLLFEGKRKLLQGLYVLRLPLNRRIDLVVPEKQYFSVRTDFNELIKQAKFEGSPDNKLYYDYLAEKQKVEDQLNILQLTTTNELLLRQRSTELDRDLNRFRTALHRGSPDLLAAKYLKAAGELPMVSPPRKPNGSVDSAGVAKLYYERFFDNIDFADERTLRAPFLQQRIERYMRRLTYPSVDSLKAAADRLAAKASVNTDVLRFCVWSVVSMYENPKVIGGDAVFVHMVEQYYLTQKVYADSSTLALLRERVSVLKPLLIGKTFPKLAITDPLGKVQRVEDSKASITAVVFYDPLCGKCRASMPAIAEWYKKYKANGVELYAVCAERYEPVWKGFLNEFKIKDLWINGWEPTGKVDFKKDFDVHGAPVIYMLNAEKKIITKRLEVNQLEPFMEMAKRSRPAAPK
jgi:thiol-disulfide isomerase/thioredoxin